MNRRWYDRRTGRAVVLALYPLLRVCSAVCWLHDSLDPFMLWLGLGLLAVAGVAWSQLDTNPTAINGVVGAGGCGLICLFAAWAAR